jgi:dTDP-4-amino-4,6-dideoxygalactose transaminase
MIPFGDLSREYRELREEIDATLSGICARGWFVLGDKVQEFEQAFADYLGPGMHAVGVGSGTEALHLALVAAGVGHGDYVITVPNTAVPTVSAVSFAGATPLLVDIDPQTYTMDPTALREVVVREKNRRGAQLKAVIPVHLYGQCADMDPIMAVAAEFDLTVIEDACQAHGALYKGKKAGARGDYAAVSFYPSKNLGAYGDGGMVVTNRREEAVKLKMLRNYGQEKRYHHKIKGFNSRLDEIQAALLLVKLKYLDHWNDLRRRIASAYDHGLSNPAVNKPVEAPWGRHVYHLYVVRTRQRDAFQAYLAAQGVQTVIHYPVAIHLQEAYQDLGYSAGDFPVAEGAAQEILSLPIFPQLRDDEVQAIVDMVNRYTVAS